MRGSRVLLLGSSIATGYGTRLMPTVGDDGRRFLVDLLDDDSLAAARTAAINELKAMIIAADEELRAELRHAHQPPSRPLPSVP